MKKRTSLLIATCFLSGLLMLTGCKDETDPPPPTVTTVPVTEVTTTSARSGGSITENGGEEITARGVCWSALQTPTLSDNFTSDGTGKGDFASELTGLTSSTTYYVRAYATYVNTSGSEVTIYGEEETFTTNTPGMATVTTAALTNVLSTTVVSGGNVTADGGETVIERGVVWGIAPGPTVDDNKTVDGSGLGEFVSNITGLTNGTVYYIRSYARNNVGVAYGPEFSFITPVTDVEGNVYKTTKIGTQVWMAENLRVTRFRNNTPIPNVRDSLTWMTLTIPAYSWYRNNIANRPDGALYTWFTVSTGNLCPEGWHVPTNEEWHTMERTIGIPADTVGFWGWRGNGSATTLKDVAGWTTGNGNNSTGFSAIGSGYRAWSDSQFRGLDQIAYWWTATDDAINNKPTVAWYRRIDGASTMVYKATTGKTGGKSIRCVKN